MFSIREIDYSDYNNGIMEIVNVFTKVPKKISYDEFCKTLDIIKQQNSYIFVCCTDNTPVGMLKVIIEQKLHNNLQCMGHIEDVATHPEHTSKGIATLLVNHAIDFCRIKNCYKVVLCCHERLIGFYKRCGFNQKGAEMTVYL